MNYDVWVIVWIGISIFVIMVLVAILGKMFYRYRRFGVPFIKSKDQGIQALLDHLELTPWDTFLDLWCGDGVVMDAVLERFPWTQAIGYEILPDGIEQSNHYKQKHRDRFIIHQSDYFISHFGNADVIYCYLLPRYIKPTWDKIQKECKPWTVFYSYVFKLDDIEPIQTIIVPVTWRKDDVLYVYEKL